MPKILDMEWDVEGFFPPAPEIPSRTTRKQCIYADSSSDEKNFDVDYEKGGKWLLYSDSAHCRYYVTGLTRHDYVWQLINKLVKNGILYEAKCSTSLEVVDEPYRNDPNGVICSYTKDYTNKIDVKRAADAIRGVVHYPSNLFYKTNNASRAGKYKYKGDNRICIYKHTMERKMYERDPVIKDKWNLVNV